MVPCGHNEKTKWSGFSVLLSSLTPQCPQRRGKVRVMTTCNCRVFLGITKKIVCFSPPHPLWPWSPSLSFLLHFALQLLASLSKPIPSTPIPSNHHRSSQCGTSLTCQKCYFHLNLPSDREMANYKIPCNKIISANKNVLYVFEIMLSQTPANKTM
jgi:hypothetical protein